MNSATVRRGEEVVKQVIFVDDDPLAAVIGLDDEVLRQPGEIDVVEPLGHGE